MNNKRRNAWLPSWFSKEQLEAWGELPLLGGKVAPHTEEFRDAYREWYRKWGKRYPRPCIVDDYAEIDRQKAKGEAVSRRSTFGDLT
jgi:hypothetical protein